MGWAFVYLFVVLKIPVVAAIWIVWWASRATPEEAAPGDPGGGLHRDHPRPRPPRPPRRGPHGDPAPAPPTRVRLDVPAPDRVHAR